MYKLQDCKRVFKVAVICRFKCCLPGGKRSHRGPEARHPPGPALPEGLFYQLALGGGVDPPEWAFARLFLRAGHFDEVPVQGQVVADRVLRQQQMQDRHKLHGSLFWWVSQHSGCTVPEYPHVVAQALFGLVYRAARLQVTSRMFSSIFCFMRSACKGRKICLFVPVPYYILTLYNVYYILIFAAYSSF